jgi:serine/threonine protein phosphatase PrpC
MHRNVVETGAGPVDDPVPVDPVIGASVVREQVPLAELDAAVASGSTGAAEEPRWRGGFTRFSVGDPGRAGQAVQPAPALGWWDQRDTVLDGVLFTDGSGQRALELRAASVRGLSHRYYGKVRQDEYAYRCTADNGFLVAAVADGVSAGRFSHHAAQVVTRQGCALIANWLREVEPDDLPWVGVLEELSAAVVDGGRRLLRQREGSQLDADGLDLHAIAGELAATALFAVVDLRADTSERTAHLLALGDTSAWVLRSGTTWEALQPIKNDGAVIATSATSALPVVPAEVGPPRRVTVGPGDALVLVSDGIGDPLGDGTGDVGAFLASVWRRPPAALEFAAQVDFARKSYDDDRTAVVLWPLASR